MSSASEPARRDHCLGRTMRVCPLLKAAIPTQVVDDDASAIICQSLAL